MMHSVTSHLTLFLFRHYLGKQTIVNLMHFRVIQQLILSTTHHLSLLTGLSEKFQFSQTIFLLQY